MLPIAYYLLKVIICSGILYGYYWLSLRNKVFHKYNRFYLMASVVLSLLLPLIKINFWQQHPEQQSGVIRVLQAVSSSDEYMDNIIVTTGGDSFDITQLYPVAYMLVSLILLVAFFHTLFVIFRLLKKYPKQTIDKISFINTDAKSTPFSFLNYIFWNYNIDVETTTGNQIFKHELAHVQEGHTYDKLFINIVLIFFWCNPFYWLYRKELNMIHEFIADKKAVEDSDTEAFAAMILQATYPQHRFQLTNNFFYSPIKRRLLMLTKNKNPKVNYLGRIMVLPLLVIIFAAFTLKVRSKDIPANTLVPTATTAAANYFMNAQAFNASFNDSTRKAMFINVKNADTNYFKSIEYKTKALVIIDDREIGNLGYNYVDKTNSNYSSIVIYGPRQAVAIYGDKGKYGVIKLTLEDAVCITADSIFFDDKKQLIKLSGTNSAIKGNLEKTLIYVDGKVITPLQLNEIKPDKISSINILKGEKLDDIADTKGKTAIINVTLKPADLAEVVVTGRQIDPVYVVDNKIQAKGFELNSITPENIERVDVLKDNAATNKYGEQAKNGVVEITTKNNISKFNNPVLSIGNLLSHTLSVEEFKKQTQLNVSDGYSFVSATVYFGGKGFSQTAVATLNGSSLEPLKGYMEKCVDGSAIVFDNIRVKKDGIGMITIDGHAFSLADGKELSNVHTDQPWATAAGQKNTANGLQEVAVTGYSTKKDLVIDSTYKTALLVTGYPNKRYADTLTGVQVDRIFTKVENEPYYPGGNEAWKKYITNNIDASVPLREGWKPGSYTVIVQFIVHSDGTVSDVTTLNYQGSRTAQHCIDLIKKSSKWLPAIQNGKAVNAYRKQPITFGIVEPTKKDITEIYTVPFKVHLMNEGKITTYHLVNYGKLTAKFKAV